MYAPNEQGKHLSLAELEAIAAFPDEEGRIALHHAVLANDGVTAAYLLQLPTAQQQALCKDAAGRIALHHAARLGHTAQADLLLHVVDASHPEWVEQLAQVQSVLGDIGAAEVPQWLIFNKVDRLAPERRALLAEDVYEWDGRALPRIFLSAATGEGMPLLRQRLAEFALSRHPQPNGTPDAEDMGSPHDSAG